MFKGFIASIDMGYLRKISGSPFWHAVFMNEKGVEIQRSTKTADRARAEEILATWSLAAALIRKKGLCAHRVRKVTVELSKLSAGDNSAMISVLDYEKRFLNCTKVSGAEMTYMNRRSALKKFNEYLDLRVAMPLEDLTKPDIAGFRDYQIAAGAEPGAAKQRIEVVHTMYGSAINDGIVKHNPCDGVVVKLPKDKKKQAAKKRKALSFEEGVKIVDCATAVELGAVVMGLDLGARIGDAFGLRLDLINLTTGRITYWVEKPDVWHTVDLFPPTLAFLQEYVEHHRPLTDSPLLLYPQGAMSGPDVDEKQRLSEMQPAHDAMRELFDRAGLGEWITRMSGARHNTVAYHCFRITNDNALKMAGVTSDWVMWRLCQKDKKSNAAYDRFNPDNGRQAIFTVLKLEVAKAANPKEEKANDGSMTFDQMKELINYAREKLVRLRVGGKPPETA
jgi:hypothetical protein